MAEERESRAERDAEAAKRAQAELDMLRGQAGGALSGREILGRLGRRLEDANEDSPPLDWRPTPMNVFLQLLALGLFLAVVLFMGALIFDGVGALFGALSGGGQ